MNKIFSILRDKHEEVYRIFLFVFTTIFIVLLFPKEGKFQYEFTKGKPWLHQELIAPFDFAIKKTVEEISLEEQEIKSNNTIYFKYDTSVFNSKLNFFIKEFSSFWENKNEGLLKNIFKNKNNSAQNTTKENTRKAGVAILRSIYKKGIIEPTDELENKSKDIFITVLNNNIAEEKRLNEVFNLQSAADFIHTETRKNKAVDADLLNDLLENCIAHNIIYDEETTTKNLEQLLANISLTRGKIQKDERLISKGDLVDNKKFEILNSLKAEYGSQSGGFFNYTLIFVGQILLVGLCLLVLFLFIFLFRKDIIVDNLRISFILLLIAMFVFLASLSLRFDFLAIYALPFCVLPIVIRAFYDTRLALYANLITTLIIGFFAPNQFEFIFIQMLAGIFAVFSIVNMSRRSQLVFTSLIIFVSYALSYIGFSIMQEGSLKSIEIKYFGWFFYSSMFTLLSYPIIYLSEKIFGFISDVSLMELSDTNSPLLRELATKAPGTFQHSFQVANLAEEAIFQIGGDALLVRTGALYHDIGKMDMPRYFIENQTTGINPHDDLSFDESAAIIISHTIKGIEKAKQHKLPEQIIDFIRTHHGDSLVHYFYRSFLKQFPDELVDEKKFRYPGPRPFSKETAVLMMADSVEASSRSLKDYTAESIDKLVEKIIESQIQQQQFINANITFKDITVIKKIFKKKLQSIYHIRVEYPK